MTFLLTVAANIVGAFVGAFVGFYLAVKRQSNTEKRNRIDIMNKILPSIKSELKDLREIIQLYIEANDLPKQIFSVPAWKTVVNSGIILELADQKTYNGIYQKVINAYCLIKKIEQGETKRKKQALEAMATFVKVSQEIIQDIDRIMSKKTDDNEYE